MDKISFDVPDVCNLKSVFYITKKDVQTIKISKNKDFKKMTGQLYENELSELDILPTHTVAGIYNNHFIKYLDSYAEFYPQGPIASYRDDIYSYIKNFFSDFEIFNIEMPRKYSKIIFQTLHDQISSGGLT